MHELIIAIAFIALVACPTLVVFLPLRELETEDGPARNLATAKLLHF